MAKTKKDFTFYWEKPGSGKSGHPEGDFNFSPSRIELPQADRSIPVNISETDKEIIVRAELAGFEKNEISLSVTELSVEISASKIRQKTEKSAGTFRQERSSHSMKRSFTLPASIDPDSAAAKLENGSLVIIMKKSRGKKKRIKVEIK